MARARDLSGRRRGMGRIGTPAQLLDSRLALRVEPGRISPASRVINGTARYTDPLRSGSPRQLQPKYGLTLNGTSEYAETGGSFVWTGTDSLAISVWVKATSSGFIVGHWNAGTTYTALIQILAGGTPRVYVSMDGTASNFRYVGDTTDIRDGQWHHIALRYQSGTLEGFLDGELFDGTVVTTGSGTAINQTASTLVIGADTGGAGLNEFTGQIDDIRIFDTALTPTQIADIAALKPGSTRGTDIGTVPLIHYKFEDPTTSAICRNSGSLGSAGDATITGTIANVRGTPSPVYCWANEVGYSDQYEAVFPGSTNRVDLGSVLIGATDDFDISFDFQADTLATELLFTQLTGSESGRMYIALFDNGSVELFIENAGTNQIATSATGLVKAGKWHTVRATRVGDVFTLYLDGVQVGAGTRAGVSVQQKNTMLGTDDAGLDDFDGRIRNVSITNNGVTTEYLTRGIGLPGATLTNVTTELVAIPRDESNFTKDIAGNDLQYVGQCPRDMVLSSLCVTLNGSSEYITSGTGDFTVSGYPFGFGGWFKSDGTTGNHIVLSLNVGTSSQEYTAIANNTDNDVLRVLRNDDVGGSEDFDTTLATTQGQWHHCYIQYNSATALDVYLDGVKESFTGLNSSDVGNDGYNRLLAGILRTTTPAGYFDGSLSGLRLYLAGLTDAQVAELASGGEVAGAVLHWPLCEGAGDIVHDVSGSGNHGTITGTLANVWANQQNKTDTLVTDGYAVGTWFDGANDYFSRATLVGGGTKLCASFKLSVDSLSANQVVFGEYKTSTPDRSFILVVETTGKLRVTISSDGGNVGPTVGNNATDDPVVVAGELYDIQFTFDAGVVTWQVDGVTVASTWTTGPPTSFYAGSGTFEIGANAGGSSKFGGTISQLLIHKDPTAVWSTATKAAIRAAGTTAEIKTIVDNLGGTAWYFPDAKTETLQNLPSLAVNGAPEQRIIPAGAGPAISYGPGLLAPGQSLDLYCGQDDAPICQLLAVDLADGTYAFADGDEGDALFKKGDANGEQIAVINPAATGAELTVLNAWSN